MAKALDLTGQRFGRLTAIERSENVKCKAAWVCRCDCGNVAVVMASDLRSGHTQSCGCLQRQRTSSASVKHGMRYTRLYHRWLDMKQRCQNPKNKRWSVYGGRGITVCAEWLNSFEAFRDWALANGYRDDLTIDRINVNGNYAPDNCRWATKEEQANNKSNTIFIEFEGAKKTLSEWAHIKKINYATLLHRYHAGVGTEEIFHEGRLTNGTQN